MLTLRPAAQRGHANHGWLDTWHSFSFAEYQDPNHMNFGPLRVINEDHVQAGAGFATHGHTDMEIVTYVLAGELAHKDSMGTGSIIRPGDAQRMSAGRGVRHSEFNHSQTDPVHLLQVWIMPDVHGIEPEYEQRHIAERERRGQLRLIASADGAGESLRIHQDAKIYAGLFDSGESAQLSMAAADTGTMRITYVQVARGSVSVNRQRLSAGDGAMLRELSAVSISDGEHAEVLIFDLPDS